MHSVAPKGRRSGGAHREPGITILSLVSEIYFAIVKLNYGFGNSRTPLEACLFTGRDL